MRQGTDLNKDEFSFGHIEFEVSLSRMNQNATNQGPDIYKKVHLTVRVTQTHKHFYVVV